MSSDLPAKVLQMSCCWSESTLAQNAPESLMAGQLVDWVPGQNITKGGSSETEANEPTASPAGPSGPMAVTTVTPVGKCPRTVRKAALSNEGLLLTENSLCVYCGNLRL